MNLKRFVLNLLLLALLTTFIIGCSKNQPKNDEIILYAEGEYWNALYTTNSSQTKESVVIDFFYKGNLSELSAANEIVFSYGTVNGSIAETLSYDKIDKAHFSIAFDGGLIHGDDKLVNIVGKSDEKIMSIIKWNDKSETLHLTQFARNN
ncbi:hypothetical protein [Paenibacillus sp. 32O-W]|uniref:hypothetical protein n=1 Tax=Paenibacillus sp. 32O-W TaxID=1695218 RepID=UPI00119CCF6F|nr:hypothetical protein [Paenibacillus sp. 32O-W]